MGEKEPIKNPSSGITHLPVSRTFDNKATTPSRIKALLDLVHHKDGTVNEEDPEIKNDIANAKVNGNDLIMFPRGINTELISGKHLAENPKFKLFEDIVNDPKVKIGGAAALAVIAATVGFVIYRHHKEPSERK